MLSGRERLALARELSGLRSDISRDISGMDKIKIVRRIAEIRALLNGDNGLMEVTVDTIDLNDQEAIDRFVLAEIKRLESSGEAFITDYYDADSLLSKDRLVIPDGAKTSQFMEQSLIESGRSALPSNLEELLSTIGDNGSAARNIQDQRHKIMAEFWNDKELRACVEEFSDSVSGDVREIGDALDALKEELKKTQPSDYWSRAYKDWYASYKEGTRQLRAKYTKAINKRDKLVEEWKVDKAKDKLDELDKLTADLKSPGRMIIDAIASKSPISVEAASDYASSQVIDKNVITSLAKKGYSEDALRADIAEFYRLVGGKIVPIQISAERSNRAFAQSGGDDGLGKIVIDGSFTKRVLWHEMGHHVEYSNELARYAAQAFLERRRESDKLYMLRDIDHKGYDRSELAYKDAFYSFYVGKYYKHGYTEVISMGFDCLATPERTAMLASKDKEHLELISGYAQSEMRPLSKLRLRKSISKKSEITNNISARSEMEKEIAKIAEKIDLDKSLYLSQTTIELARYENSHNDTEWLGRLNESNVFYGKSIRNPRTWGRRSGYVFIEDLGDEGWSKVHRTFSKRDFNVIKGVSIGLMQSAGITLVFPYNGDLKRITDNQIEIAHKWLSDNYGKR